MDIRQLKAFVAIAETGTFTAGAARVHVTQAAISMQIRQLEDELGVRLFTRLPRRVLLTEAGEALLARARTILREHNAAIVEMAELAGAERGRLRVGSASAMVSADPLPTLLKELRKDHARADLFVTSGTSESLVAQILAGELDVAFVSLPVESQEVQTELLSRDELVAIAHPSHKLASQRVISAAMLGAENLILGERGGNTRRQIDEFFIQSGVRPNITMELSRLAAIKRMVEEGMGVGIVPTHSVREEIATGRLVYWWIKGARFNWELGLARLGGGHETPIIKTFVHLCRSYFNAHDASGALFSTSRRPGAKPPQQKTEGKRAAR
jgi:DNA-binding transcriptional LysR family regulator